MVLPCRESPTTGTVACSNSWAVLGGANPHPPRRQATPSKARDTSSSGSPDREPTGDPVVPGVTAQNPGTINP